MSTNDTIDASIAHWTDLANQADAFAAYEESRGHTGVTHRNKARTYRRTAEALGLENTTGRAHCVCCLKPLGGKVA